MKRHILIAALALCGAARTARAADAPAYSPLDFHALSDFSFDIPDGAYNDKPNLKKLKPKISSMIPKSVKALDGTKVQIAGFMLPLDEEAGGARKFILMRNQITCCFGGANRVNEYIMVTMNGPKPAPFIPNVPVSVRGTLTVGADFQDGVLNGIYQMAGEEVHP
jgi:hypothetical protein